MYIGITTLQTLGISFKYGSLARNKYEIEYSLLGKYEQASLPLRWEHY